MPFRGRREFQRQGSALPRRVLAVLYYALEKFRPFGACLRIGQYYARRSCEHFVVRVLRITRK